MRKPPPKFFAIGQSVALRNQPTARHARIENVVGFIRGSWLYQVSYQVFDSVSPEGSTRRYSQPFSEGEIR